MDKRATLSGEMKAGRTRAPAARASAAAPRAAGPRRGAPAAPQAAAAASEQSTATTRVGRNANFAKLQAGYLFPEIARMRREHQAKYPDAKVISLGIGDTTEPVPAPITDAMAGYARGLNTLEGYSGYGAEQGNGKLRAAIAEEYYGGTGIKDDDVFISDGSKCDISRLQMIFAQDVRMAVQDPSYPAYVDSSVISGKTGGYDDGRQQYTNVVYMPCLPENNFFPDLERMDAMADAEKPDVIFFCSVRPAAARARARAPRQKTAAGRPYARPVD